MWPRSKDREPSKVTINGQTDGIQPLNQTIYCNHMKTWSPNRWKSVRSVNPRSRSQTRLRYIADRVLQSSSDMFQKNKDEPRHLLLGVEWGWKRRCLKGICHGMLTRKDLYRHNYFLTYMHTYIHTHICVYSFVRSFIHLYIYMYITRTCIYVFTYLLIHLCVCVQPIYDGGTLMLIQLNPLCFFW